MENNDKLIKSLIEGVTEYGKTSLELVKLKTVDKTSEVVSTIMPNLIVVIVVGFCLLFLFLGLAVWFGELIGSAFAGFFVIAAFCAFAGLILHLLFHKMIKRYVYNSIIKNVLK